MLARRVSFIGRMSFKDRLCDGWSWFQAGCKGSGIKGQSYFLKCLIKSFQSQILVHWLELDNVEQN